MREFWSIKSKDYYHELRIYLNRKFQIGSVNKKNILRVKIQFNCANSIYKLQDIHEIFKKKRLIEITCEIHVIEFYLSFT